MADTTSTGFATSFSNTPQAKGDSFGGLTEDTYLKVTFLDVMANDLGGNAKSLYSLDDGLGSLNDLLQKDGARVESMSTDFSTGGAHIWITSDGKVGYDPTTFSAATQLAIQALAPGESFTDTFTYAIRLGNGAISWATAKVIIAGVNDAAVVTGAVLGGATEDGAAVTVDALANAFDVDHGQSLSVVGVPATLPPGVTYDAMTHQFTLDPSAAAYQHLALGQTQVIEISYGVSDGLATTGASVKFTVTGTNDAPVAQVATNAATEGGATINGNVTATDVDDGAALSYSLTGGAAPAGLTFNSDGSYSFDPTVGAYDHLAAGATEEVVVSFRASDGSATSNVQTLTIKVTGTNDAPVAQAATSAATEGGATINGNVTATDVDDGAALSYSLTGGAAPAGLTFNSDGSYSFDPMVGAYDHLAAGAEEDVVVSFRASDGTATSNVQTLTIKVTGTNDAPVIDSGATGSVAENAPASTVIYTATATDADLGDSVTWSLGGDDAAAFSIDANGAVRLNASADFESKASYAISVIANDGSTSVAKEVSIQVADANEAATAVMLTPVATAIDENASTAVRIKVADIAVVDDALGTRVLAVGGADAASFEIIGDALYLRAGVVLDFETKASFAVDVTVDDPAVGGNPDAAQSFTLGVNDLAEGTATGPTGLKFAIAPESVQNSGNGLPGAGAALGSFTAVDSDGGTFTYSEISDKTNGLASDAFTVNASTGAVTLNSGIVANTTYSLGVQVSDELGRVTSTTLTVQVGGNAGETLNSTATTDVEYAQGGNDALFGGGGNDVLFGGSGANQLHGGAGADALYGNSGSDTFYFDTALGLGGVAEAVEKDTLYSFNAASGGQSDTLWLSKNFFSGLTTGGSAGGTSLNGTEFTSVSGTGASTSVGSGVHVIFDSTTGNLFYDADGGTAGGRTLFAAVDMASLNGTFDAGDIKVGL